MGLDELKAFTEARLRQAAQYYPSGLEEVIRTLNRSIKTVQGICAVNAGCYDLLVRKIRDEDSCLDCCVAICNLTDFGGVASSVCAAYCLKRSP